jgi:hypothetical protein
MMCKETKRLTPFKSTVLTAARKQTIREGLYASHNFTNHAANKRGLALWTDEHKQAWELAQMDELSVA